MDYSQIITIEAGKRRGKPSIRGLRITVSDVLDLASGMSHEQVLRDFPTSPRKTSAPAWLLPPIANVSWKSFPRETPAGREPLAITDLTNQQRLNSWEELDRALMLFLSGVKVIYRSRLCSCTPAGIAQ